MKFNEERLEDLREQKYYPLSSEMKTKREQKICGKDCEIVFLFVLNSHLMGLLEHL